MKVHKKEGYPQWTINFKQFLEDEKWKGPYQWEKPKEDSCLEGTPFFLRDPKSAKLSPQAQGGRVGPLL